METIFEKMYRLLQDGEDFEFVSVLESSGSTPRKAGANMIIKADGTFFGTIGGGSLEFDAINRGVKLLLQRENLIHNYSLNNYEAANIGMVCGGNTTVYFMFVNHNNQDIQKALQYYISLKKAHKACYLRLDITENELTSFTIIEGKINGCYLNKSDVSYCYKQPIISAGKVYIFGGGHISRCLVPLLQSVFFQCVVVESDESFIEDEKFPTLSEKIICPFEKVDQNIRFSEHDYVVIMTRGHLHDAIVLSQVLKYQLAYIGMIGSKTKIQATYQKLSDENQYSDDDFKRVYAPIGIKIGGETPQEIAVSISAELIKVRHDKEKREMHETN